MKAKFIDVGGLRTRYLYEGEGNDKALLLVHGGGTAADAWIRCIDTLAEDFAVFAPDNVGHGFTDSVDIGTDLPQPYTVRHLIDLMDALGIDKFYACGSSYGALIVGLLYFEVPDRVEKLIMLSSSSAFATDENYRKSMRAAFENSAKTMANPDLADCRRRLSNIVYDPESIPEGVLMMQVTQYAQPDRVEFYTKANKNRVNAEGPIGHRIVGKLDQVEVPALVIAGKQDPRANWERIEVAVESMPRAELHVIDKCGHLPHIEHSERVVSLAKEFLKR